MTPTVLWAATVGTVLATGPLTATYKAPANASGTARVIATVGTTRDTTLISFAAASVTALMPYGHYSAWSGTTLDLGAPFTLAVGTTQPSYVPGLIAALKARRAVGIMDISGGGHTAYLTNGVFDITKWRAQLARYAPVRDTLIAAWKSGTLLGFLMLDEPHNPRWGPSGTLTKPMVDQMCTEVRALIPGPPVGITHQPDLFYPSTSYKVCDFLLAQYVWRKTDGDVQRFRDDALAYAKRDGIALVFSLNILDGGVQGARDGTWTCPVPLTGGRGTFDPNCRMTAAQVKSWGLVLGSAGCALTMWRQDAAFMAKAENQAAFRDVWAGIAMRDPQPCRRPV